MKRLKDLFLFLGLEVTSVLVAGGSFALIPSKVVAGAVAGTYFLCFSAFMMFRILKWPNWHRAWTFYPLALFLFGVAIPMLWVRFTHVGQSFNELTILGIPGPEFHHLATSALGLLFLVTLAETAFAVRQTTNRE